MVKILGILDLLAAILLIGTASGVGIPTYVLIFISVCLFLKACISIKEGVIDLMIASLIILSVFFVMPSYLLFIGVAFMGFKGVMSLFA